MDILQPLVVAAVRPAHLAHGVPRAPRAVTPAGEAFDSRLTDDRAADEANPHGPPPSIAPPARSMFFSLLSDGMQDSLRQMFLGGLSYRMDEASRARVGEPGGDDAGAPQARLSGRGLSSHTFTVSNDAQAPDGSLRGIMRQAAFAYSQSMNASPAFPFARPAEIMNLVA